MAGRLTARGLGCAAIGAAWLGVGAALGRPEAAFAGAFALIALGAWRVLALARASALLGGGLEVAWSLARTESGALRAGEAFELRVRVRASARAAIGRVRVEIEAPPAIAVEPIDVAPEGGAEVEAVARGRALAAGRWYVGGLRLEIEDAPGLVVHHARVRGRRGVDVLPRTLPARAAAAIGAVADRPGLPPLRRPGHGMELREIRPWAPGDPFRRIAWKATARSGRLMVRQFEAEARARRHLALDVGADLRAGNVGQQPLDAAIEAAWSFVRASQGAGEPVGLSTFDGRLLEHHEPATGRRHQARLLRALLDVRRATDEDLTEATDGEVAAAVARYLRLEAGLDARVDPPGALDPAWESLCVGPDGVVYDLHAMVAAAREDLAGMRASPLAGERRVRASTPAMVVLRALARERGLDLVARRVTSALRRTAGIEAVLRAAAAWRGPHDVLVLCGRLDVETDGALARVARHALARHRLTIVAAEAAPECDRFFRAHGARVRTVRFEAPRLLAAMAARRGARLRRAA